MLTVPILPVVSVNRWMPKIKHGIGANVFTLSRNIIYWLNSLSHNMVSRYHKSLNNKKCSTPENKINRIDKQQKQMSCK